MTTTFARLGLPDSFVETLKQRDIHQPFPIQTTTIPDALSGADVLGKAPTGSGKTLAFGLPVLARVERARGSHPSALILAPTRELAEQIKQELAAFAKKARRTVYAVYGGVGYGPQISALRKGVDVLIATPGRLEDLIERRDVSLDRVTTVVLDEADRMADMGFLPPVMRILDQTDRHRQTLLFSATLDGEVAVLSKRYQRDPVRHEAGAVETDALDAEHHFWVVNRPERVAHTADLVRTAGRSIVFTRTRHGADRLARQLHKHDVGAVALHGGRSQRQRDRALQDFSSGKAQALIATDVAARGIHVDGVAFVVHFDPPDDAKAYVHRSGRTARAGETGTVVSLITGEQKRSARRMQRELDIDVPIGPPRLEELRVPTPVRAAAKPRSGAKPEPNAPRQSRDRKPRAVREERSRELKRLYVSNLPWKTTDRDVKKLFGRFGAVHRATVVTDRRTGRSRGFGFVDMPANAARSAIDELNGSSLHGRDLTVKVARPANRRR